VTDQHYELTPIGRVESPLLDPADAPRQGYEGAPAAWLVFERDLIEALDGLEVGDRIIVITWLHRARRDVLRTYPGRDTDAPVRGVFGLRSPDRPNPIGLHPVEILAISGNGVRVSNLEAVDGTPILDVKPVLSPIEGQ
jgi:tRNA-Thr(GGU) m(6)t(6)A37 methyltransferase TsaA